MNDLKDLIGPFEFEKLIHIVSVFPFSQVPGSSIYQMCSLNDSLPAEYVIPDITLQQEFGFYETQCQIFFVGVWRAPLLDVVFMIAFKKTLWQYPFNLQDGCSWFMIPPTL